MNGLQVMKPADRELILLDSLEPEGFGDIRYQDIFRFCNIWTAIIPVLWLAWILYRFHSILLARVVN